MKTKISFTSVLKNKNATKQINNSSQYSTQSQSRPQKLIDIYQQFQSYPDQDYTLDFSVFKNMIHRSRNSSLGMIKSRNVGQDPQMNLQSWIQNQKIKQYNESQYKTNYSQKGFKDHLNTQKQILPNTRSKSTFKKPTDEHDHQFYQQQTDHYQMNKIHQSKKYSYGNQKIQESNRITNKQNRKNSINFKSQSQERYLLQNQTDNNLMIQSSQKTPQQYLAVQPLKQRKQYPGIQAQDYKKLEEEFDKIKAQKIAELCMHTKKSANKQKVQQIIVSTIENIHNDIEKMAQQIVRDKRIAFNNQNYNKKNSEQQQSQEMLISEEREDQKQEMSQSEQQLRQQKMRNMIKGYINGIQEAKSQGKNNSNSHQETQQQQVYFQQNTFNNGNYHNQPSFQNISSDLHLQPKAQNANKKSYNNNMQSVGYSFSNSNMICQHSFNKQIGVNNNYPTYQTGFQKNHIQPAIYQPQNEDQQVQQRISLPYIEQVKSDCGDFTNQNHEVQSSEEIQFARKRLQKLDISGRNIKNIQSVHYQPPQEQIYQTQNNNIFKNFQKSSQNESYENMNAYTQFRKQNMIVQAPKFISKTFNSYISGEKRFQYGQIVVNQQNQQRQINVYESNNASNLINNKNYIAINPPILSNSQSTAKVTPITKFSPKTNKNILQGSNINNQLTKLNSLNSPQIQPTKKPSIQQIKNSINKPNLTNHGSQSNKVFNQMMNQSSNFQVNQSTFLSLNQSINNQNNSIASITSPKNLHQLQSKKKFSVNSPLNKAQEQKVTLIKNPQQSNVREFLYTTQNITSHTKNSLYATSLPAQEFSINQISKNKLLPQNSQERNYKTNYACSQSIIKNQDSTFNSKNYEYFSKKQQIYASNKDSNIFLKDSTPSPLNNFTKNSILQMQPLKLSIRNSSNIQNLPIQKSSIQSIKRSESKFINQYPGIQKIVESHENKDFQMPYKRQIPSKNNTISNVNDGKNFLLSLNTKQSIQIDLPHENHKQTQESKESFATQTFRPSLQNNSTKPTIPMERSTPTNKASITKITLKSSSDKNPINSPKIISLTVNNLNQNKFQSVKPFNQTKHQQEKQNIFQKLTIKDSSNLTQHPIQKKISFHQSQNSSNFYMKQSIKTQNITLITKTQTHLDMASKQNTNTLNQLGKIDITKNQSMKFDLNLEDNNTISRNSLKQSISTSNKTPLIEKKQPLLKLSKNFGNSSSQSTNNNLSLNVKKSMGESIKPKTNFSSTSIMLGSKGMGMNSIKSSFKGGVKQSIGNDSDMDFDLQLD